MVPVLPREDRFLVTRRRLAIEKLEAGLNSSYPCRPLSFVEAHTLRGAVGLKSVWEITHSRLLAAPSLFLGVDNGYPTSVPKLFLAPAENWFLRIPHINRDGSICLLVEQSTVDQHRPGEVAIELIERAIAVIGDGLVGTNRDDFITEAESYWQQASNGFLFTALDPLGPPSRLLKATYSPSRERLLIANSEQELKHRVKAIGWTVSKNFNGVDVPLIWSHEPLYPDNYPATNAQLADLVENSGFEGLPALLMVSREKRIPLPVVLAFQTPNGVAGFGAMFEGLSQTINGFRPRSVTAELLLSRVGARPCTKHALDRADAAWLNWRGGASVATDEFAQFTGKNVLVVGCGSIGADVAMLLAKAGVSGLTLVDHEVLTWDNIGRHLLGASQVGLPKSSATARALTRHLPHLEVGYEIDRIERLVQKRPGFLGQYDVTVCLTGDWKTESLLNSLQRRHGYRVVFGWVEAHGLAGHALFVNREGGCLGCGRDEGGGVRDQVIRWHTDPIRQVPACGGGFTPHGASETSTVKGMIADLTLEALVDNLRPSEQRVCIGSGERIARQGGTITPVWQQRLGSSLASSHLFISPWHENPACPLCNNR